VQLERRCKVLLERNFFAAWCDELIDHGIEIFRMYFHSAAPIVVPKM
jgi:hypothetical protein